MGKITFKDYLEELKKHTPYNFCDYSGNSIQRRIEKILKDLDMDMDQLLVQTKTDEEFVEKLVDDITVNTTELFRNPETWEYLYSKVFPSLKNKKSINVWHAGCSTGQEVYSNLILLNEFGILDKVNVVATDINQKVILGAKKAEYDLTFNDGYIEVFNSLMRAIHSKKGSFANYFDMDKRSDIMKVKDHISKKPIFKRHDLVEEEIPFYQKFDIIFCRNVLIYFKPELQLKIVRKFYDKLYDGGVLVLGSHEALHGFFKTRFLKNGMVYTKSSTFHFKYK